MNRTGPRQQFILRLIISAIWLINGLFCKVLHLVPRHEHIVAKILGSSTAYEITMLIGIAETAMAIWVFSGYRVQFNAILQITLVLTMNVLEFTLAQDLLLFERINLLFAIAFCAMVYYYGFIGHSESRVQQ